MAPNQQDRTRAVALATAAEELEAFASVGGRSVVDIATARTDRDIAAIRKLTQRVPSHLVVAAGLPADTSDPIAHLRRECAAGIDGSEVSAGLVVLEREPGEHTLLDAGMDVAREHGMPVLVHIGDWHDAEDLIARWNVSPSDSSPSLIVGGPNGFPDPVVIATAAERGVFVVIDVPTNPTPTAERVLAQRLVTSIRAGHAESLLVTITLVGKRLPVAAPTEPRAPYLIDRLAIAMMEVGASAYDVRQVMIENPARALTIHPRIP